MKIVTKNTWGTVQGTKHVGLKVEARHIQYKIMRIY